MRRLSPLLRLDATRPLAPLSGMVLLAFGSTAIHAEGTAWDLVVIAAATAAAVTVAALLVPWHRLPASVSVLPPLASFAVIGLLRQAQGGSHSGYSPLVILPCIWMALTMGRRMVFACTAATAALFGIPILYVGDPLYPANGWRGALLWTAVTLVVGLVVNGIVAELREIARTAREHAAELTETQRALEAVGSVAREIAAGADPRQLICDGALRSGAASIATIVEPTRDGGFTITGAAGIEIDDRVRPNASLRSFFACQRLLVADVVADAGVAPAVAGAIGLVSVLYEPIVRHGRPVGVLCLGWRERHETISDRAAAVASLLAAEAGAAIERADLVARLDRLARTDELTGLPNRRAWDAAFEQKLAEPRRAQSVALIDLDHFKAFNDAFGHLAGDDLLRRAAAAWTEQLRGGDLLARYGGEEFALLLDRCPLAEAAPVLERLRAATPGGITCSIGVVEPRPGETDADVLARADDALYEAKRQGRNRLLAA